jgi:putative endonuclease
MYYVYVLKSKKDNKLYIGLTNNLKKRLREHNKGLTPSTRYRRPLSLIYYEAYLSPKDAQVREQKLKKFKKSYQELKKRIINSFRKCKSGGGFTLIETITAIFILTTGVLALSSLISYFISTSSISSQRLVAAYLAQEGIEIVRNIRDSAYISGDASNWNNVTRTCSVGCSNFDYRSSKIPDNENCSGKYFLDLVGNFYQCSTSSPIQLQRTVTTTQISNPDGVKVKVEVTWRERGRLHSLKAEENFYNWRE